MTSWKVLYENRFPTRADGQGTILEEVRAPEGRQTIASGPVFLLFAGSHGFGIAAGRNITYRPEGTFRDVIGLDAMVEFIFVSLPLGSSVPLLEVSGGVRVTLVATSEPTATGKVACRLDVALDGVATSVDGVSLRLRAISEPQQRRRLRVRWSTTGQLHVWLDDSLIAYENSFQPSFRFNVNRVTVGDRVRPINGAIHLSVTYVRVLQLREDDPVESLAEQLSPTCVPDVSERCARASEIALLQTLRRARSLMADFNASKTSAWRKGDGGNPFAVEALAVHKAGEAAGEAFARYMREGDAESRARIRDHLHDLVSRLAADQPQSFKNLVLEALALRERLDEHCREAVDAIRSQNPQLFEKLDPLGHEMQAILQNLIGEA